MNTAQLVVLWYAGLLVALILVFQAFTAGSVHYLIAAVVAVAGMLIYTLKPHPAARKAWVAGAVLMPPLLLAGGLWMLLSWETSTRPAPSPAREKPSASSPGLAPRQWTWTGDMTGDGRVTIRDVPKWTRWLFYHPGDGGLYLLARGGGSSPLLQFLEQDPPHYGGTLSFILSLIAWAFLVSVVVGLGEDIRRWSEDRRLRRTREEDSKHVPL